MRFGQTHRFSTGALATLGVGSLLLTPALHGGARLGALAALAAALVFPARLRGRFDRALRGLIGAGAVAAVALDPSPSAATPLVALLVAAQIERLATRRGADHDGQILALAVAHFVVGALLGGGALQGVGLLAAMLLGPLALGLSMLRRQVEANARMGARDKLGRSVDLHRILRSKRVVEGGALRLLLFWSAAPALVAVALFALAPHHARPLLPGVAWASAARRAPLAPDRLSPSVVLIAEAGEPAPGGVYFRRGVLHRFDGRGGAGSPPAQAAAPGAQAPWPAGLRVRWVDADVGPLQVPYDAAGLEAAPAPADLGPYLSMPARSRLLADLASSWTEGASTPLDRALAIEARLRQRYVYDLASPSLDDPSPLLHFLAHSRRGHCELFAGAMVALLRELGVPSRVAVGYVARGIGQGRLLARGTDAHAWVEVYLEGQGWRRFDPTPTSPSAGLRQALDPVDWAWSRGLDGGGLDRARLLALGALLGSIAALAAALGSPRAWALRGWAPRRSPTRADGAAGDASGQRALGEMLDRALAAQGLGRPPGVPPLLHAQSDAVQAHPLGPLVVELTQRYLRARFGGEPLDDDERREFTRKARQIEAYQRSQPPARGA